MMSKKVLVTTLASVLFLFLTLTNLVSTAKQEKQVWNTSEKKNITLVENNWEFYFENVAEKTVGEFLLAHGLAPQTGDQVLPDSEKALFSGARIYLERARKITVRADGQEKTFYTRAKNVELALRENQIALNEDDFVKPGRESLTENNTQITVTRVKIEEQTQNKPIAFDKKIVEDDKLSWRKTMTTQKGESGAERLTYRVSLYDGKEVNRKLLTREIVKEPVTEIITQGTFVKIGKTHAGLGTWYAFTGKLAAASPWLPLGSYARVTNQTNGQSVIVVINDRGPFGKNRIIDLDKVAFQKIAPLGAGVINVKVEEIVN